MMAAMSSSAIAPTPTFMNTDRVPSRRTPVRSTRASSPSLHAPMPWSRLGVMLAETTVPNGSCQRWPPLRSGRASAWKRLASALGRWYDGQCATEFTRYSPRVTWAGSPLARMRGRATSEYDRRLSSSTKPMATTIAPSSTTAARAVQRQNRRMPRGERGAVAPSRRGGPLPRRTPACQAAGD